MAREDRQIVGEICLYGAPSCGFGWLAVRTANGALLGDGEPRPYWSATDAMWHAAICLRRWEPAGAVRVFAPGGERVATMDVNGLRYFGELEWRPAPVYAIDAAAIVDAAE